jgi:hypothetical protein
VRIENQKFHEEFIFDVSESQAATQASSTIEVGLDVLEVVFSGGNCFRDAG